MAKIALSRPPREYWQFGLGNTIEDEWRPEGGLMEVLAATDGSGGPAPAAQDPRLRRVGWAFVIYTVGQLIPLAAMYGGTDAGDEAGDPEGQTVPLSEILAMTQLLYRLAGEINATVYCDCSHVVELSENPLSLLAP